MGYEILFIQGAGDVTTAQEQVIVDALRINLGDGFTIIYPPMPDADHPAYLAWEAVLTKHLRRPSGKVILLGHSLGASIILKHFSREPVPAKVIGMILFGVPYWKHQHWDVSEYEIADNFLGNLSTLENIYFYHSMDDEVIPDQQFKSYQKLIPNAHWRVFSGMDHSYHGAIPDMIKDIQDLAGA
jgi:predicted alpha/beta hydrolase family esterase